MVEIIKKYVRYKDYYSFSCIEVKIAAAITFVLIFLMFEFFSFYESFKVIESDIKQIIVVVIGGEFTLLGMSLAGMAIITSLISPEVLSVINKIDREDTINRVLSHFEFSAFNFGVQISYFILIYFALISKREVIEKIPFIICSTIICYHFFFNLFYIISLIGDCIKINEIKTQSKQIASYEKTFYNIVNELRIDYLLALSLKEKGIKREQLLKDLYVMIDKSNLDDKPNIKEYLCNYYGNG